MNKAKYILFGIIIGICISFSFYAIEAKITRERTEAERKEIVQQSKLKQEYKNEVVSKLTMKSLDKRLKRVEKYLFEKGNK